MELYHKTLLQPNTPSIALAVHLDPIKPRQEYDRPKQMLLCRSNALELYRCTSRGGNPKYQLKMFHQEQVFGSICAADIIAYQDQDLRQDFLIFTLSNGKYQLLEWRVQKMQFALTDQKLIFSQEKDVESGLCKPKIGQYISVNNQAKLVMIASVQWECKLYSRSVGVQGIRLVQVAHLRGSPQVERPSICLQLAAGSSSNCLFYSLRSELNENEKVVKVYKLRRAQEQFEEDVLQLQDKTCHLLIPRSGEGNYFVFGEKYMYYNIKGKFSQLKIPQSKASLQTTWWRRPLRQKKEEYFILNENGELIIINFDDGNQNPCTINFVEPLVPSLSVAPIEKNLFFLMTNSSENMLIEALGKYKCQDRIQKTRSSSTLKQMKQQSQREDVRGQFRQFDVVATMESGRLIRDMKICNIQKSMSNQILITGGRPCTKKGFISIMKYGLKVKTHLSINLPTPQGIWAIKKNVNDKYHTFIVISLSSRKTNTYYHQNGKLIPSHELRLDENQNTLHINRFQDNSMVQVAPSKLRYYPREGSNRLLEVKGRISKAISVNQGKQLLLQFIGGYIEYYEIINGELVRVKQSVFDSQVNHIEFSPPTIIDGKPFSKFFAIGLSNYYVQIYSINADRSIELVCAKNLKCSIESIVMAPHAEPNICVYIGTNIGKVIKWILGKNGEPLETQEQVIAQKSIKLSKLTVLGKTAVFRINPQPCLTYMYQGQAQDCSIPLTNMEHVAEMSLDGIEGTLFITYFGGYLRLIQIYGFGNLLYTSDKELQYPGRKIMILQDRLGVLTEGKIKIDDKQNWISKFFVLNPLKDYTSEKNIAFEQNQKVLSMTSLTTKDGKNILCFGCCIGHTNFPSNNSSLNSRSPSIKIYSYEKSGQQLIINHLFTFPLEDPPTAMESYFSQLLLGVGRKLLLFDIYKQKLVLRASSDSLSSQIMSIHVDGPKIFLTQVFQSFSLMKHNPKNKCFDLIGQDFIERFSVSSCLMDGDAGVLAGGDKYGNLYVSKMSQKMKFQFEEIKENPFQPNYTTFIMQSLVSYHIGEIVTAIQSGKIDSKKPDCIFYATIDGRIGMFYPFEGEQEQDLFTLKKLQTEMTRTSFCGASNHKFLRNSFNPAKSVTDGDLCELFELLSQQQKARITSSLERDPKEISNLLVHMQSKFS